MRLRDRRARLPLLIAAGAVLNFLFVLARRLDPSPEHVFPAEWRSQALSAVVFVGSLAAFLGQLRLAHDLGALSVRSRAALCLGGLILQCLPLFFTPLTFSTDVFVYIGLSRIQTVHGGNPVTDIPAAFADPFFDRITFGPWHYTVSPYGPVWNRIAQGLGELAQLLSSSPEVYLLLFRLASLVALAACVAALLLLRGATLALPVVGALAWNPYLQIASVLEGHNDVWMLAFALMALALFDAGRSVTGAASLWASVLTKWTTACLGPAFGMAAVLSLTAMPARDRLKVLAGSLALVSLLSWAAFRPYWAGRDTFAILDAPGALIHFGSLQWALLGLMNADYHLFRALEVELARAANTTTPVDWRWISQNSGAFEARVWLKWLGWIATAGVALFQATTVRRFHDLARAGGYTLLAYVLLGTTMFWPWYAVPVVGLLLAAGTRREYIAAIGATLGFYVAMWIEFTGWSFNQGWAITLATTIVLAGVAWSRVRP